MDSYERLKKIGAGALILLITLMMGIMFLPGDIQDFTGTFSSTAVGSYDGKAIGQSDYRLVYASCDERIPRFGDDKFRNVQLANCTSRSMREFYVLAHIGTQLGLTVSDKQVADTVLRQAREAFGQQQRTARDSDDRLTLDEIYTRQLRYMPLSYRKRAMDAELVAKVLTRRFPFPEAQAEADRLAEEVRLDVQFVRYSNAQLLRGIETRVQVTEPEIRKLYDTEQAKLAADKRKPYDEERKAVERRLLAAKRDAELKSLKEQLGKLGANFTLDQVSALTGVGRAVARDVAVAALNEVKTTGGGSVNLSIPDVILKIAPGSGPIRIGPVVRDEFTYFIEVQNVRSGKAAGADADKGRRQDSSGADLAAYMLREMLDQQAQRADFKLKRDIFRQGDQ